MRNSTNKSNFSGILEEAEIESLLSQVLPKPSHHFYKMMETAPWKKALSQKHEAHSITSTSIRKWMLGFAIITVFLFIFGVSFFPSIRAIAHQIAYSFLSSPSNKIEVQVTSSAPEDLFHFSDPSNFTQTIEEVQEMAGFIVKVIDQRPESLKLIGARFEHDYHAVTILYEGEDYKLFLVERQISNGKDVFSIGTSALIQLVDIGDHQGEFVVGGWKAISTQTISDNDSTESQTYISAVWDAQLPQYTLRWQENGFAYELRALGEGSPSQSDLIAYANGLK